MIKRLLCIKRCFIVCYKAQAVSGPSIDGIIQFTTNGCFLNYKTCQEQIKNFVKGGDEHWELKSVIITNVIEISKRDYKDWIKREKFAVTYSKSFQ